MEPRKTVMADRKHDAGAPVSEREAELREDFAYVDEDGDGLLQVGEFIRFMDELGAEMSDEDCRIGFEEIDSDRDGVIEFREFLDWWTMP
ncbi:MAG TPA: EF-hand domain-containing protein [Steroidobacteraceae bacterium]|nr:EF-hand domain-containing protein [Steroidobacteraceae bacterium]